MKSEKPVAGGAGVIEKKRSNIIYLWLGDKIFSTIVVGLGIAIILLTLGMAWVLFDEGRLALGEFGFFDFIAGTTWDPAVQLLFGAWPFIFGTIVTSTLALAISFFPAVAVAIFSAEYAAG